MCSRIIFLCLFCSIIFLTSCEPESLPPNENEQVQGTNDAISSETGNENTPPDDDKEG